MTDEQIAQQWRELHARHKGEILELGGKLIGACMDKGEVYRDALGRCVRIKQSEYREK